MDLTVLPASMGPRHLSRGIEIGARIKTYLDRASMGPRHLSRGIGLCPPLRLRLFRCFNGATAFEPWNRQSAMPRFAASSCGFNGATAFEPWNPAAAGAMSNSAAASMGPRHLSRGIAVAVSMGARILSASMGPRHLSRGIGREAEHLCHEVTASMGPRHLSRGIR